MNIKEMCVLMIAHEETGSILFTSTSIPYIHTLVYTNNIVYIH